METRASKARDDARWEAEAESREQAATQEAERLLSRTIADDCPCDRERSLDPHCCAAGMCARDDDNE